MEFINTPHINQTAKIAKTVVMPGDPQRAKYIADTFLEEVEQFNEVRGMLGYTGKYQGKEISVMGSGMGMPSIGIYSYELYDRFGVENIIRIGSAGAYTNDLNLYDIVLVDKAYSESTYALVQSGYQKDTISASPELNKRVKEYAAQLKTKIHEETVHSSDVFYRQKHEEYQEIHQKHGCVAVEMESFALFNNAHVLKKKATCLLTISDSLVKNESATAHERQTAFNEMIKIALEFAE